MTNISVSPLRQQRHFRGLQNHLLMMTYSITAKGVTSLSNFHAIFLMATIEESNKVLCEAQFFHNKVQSVWISSAHSRKGL